MNFDIKEANGKSFLSNRAAFLANSFQVLIGDKDGGEHSKMELLKLADFGNAPCSWYISECSDN